MNSLEHYFNRYSTLPPFFADAPDSNTAVIIIIPCYDDEYIFNTLASLESSAAASSLLQPDRSQPTNHHKRCCEVIVHVNSGISSPHEIVMRNRNIYNKLQLLADEGYYKGFRLLPFITENVGRKKAGVGYARRLAMDEALRRFAHINNPDGLIVSLDADTLVARNYIDTLLTAADNRNTACFTFQFRHNCDANLYPTNVINACQLYEMYLRYYRLALKLFHSPFAIHTIGSCFAVRANAYSRIGGMPPKQGGEDFYFLQKATKMQKVCEIHLPVVFPSPRISNRVPFGTGPSVKNIVETGYLKVYNFQLFLLLKQFYDNLHTFSEKSPPQEIVRFTGDANFQNIINECSKNTASIDAFVKRALNFFDAFFIVKFLNTFNNSTTFPPVDILTSVKQLFMYYNIDCKDINLYNELEQLDMSI
jgi:hypothetical protein